MAQNKQGIQVTIGVPVYNGADLLAATLDNLLAQSYQDFQIIISNNGSTDGSGTICDDYAGKDERIRVVHQDETTNPTLNFRFVLDQADTPYFMWCAHDDTRDLDFIETLVGALEAPENKGAVLAFGDVMQNIDEEKVPLVLDFVHNDRSMAYRLYWAAVSPLHHLYGVWRTEALQGIKWSHTNWWHDTPLMMAAELVGDFVHVPGVTLHYLYNRHYFFDKGASPKQLLMKAADLVHLIYQSGRTVARVGGVWSGFVASGCSFVKVAQQSVGFVRNRL